MADLQMIGNILLLIAGLVLAIPPVFSFLAGLIGGGTAYIPIILGIICVLVALVVLFKK